MTTSSPSSKHGYCEIESVETTSTKNAKVILEPMKINFPVGSVTAILGPSGSGKTTLLNTLTNSIPSNVRAQAKIHLPGASAFVPQDDQLHGFYTCQGYMEHYARLSGIDSKSEETQKEIQDLLKAMGLTHQAKTIVGDVFLKGLSGGQKRRLSIALEALTQPKNLFLDEPTSGLDAESALQVMDFLRHYVREAPNRRVILTIHQPSSFLWQLIDNAVLLSKGKLMYQGQRSKMEDFFEFAGFPTPSDTNPADHYVTVVNDEFRHHELSISEWEQQFLEYNMQIDNFYPDKEDDEIKESPVASPDSETRRSKSPLVVFELTYRYFLNLWFNPGILATRVAMYAMLALMVGALFWRLGDRTDFESVLSRAAVLFYCVAFFIFMSVAVLPFTVIERAIVDKEVRNGYYHPFAYQISQALSSIPGTALLALITTIIIITMTKLSGPYWYFLTMFLSLICAEALAQLVSHIVPHFVIGMAVIAGLYGFFMLFQGFMIQPSDFPTWLRWTYYVAFHSYAWRTFMYTEFAVGEADTIFEGPYRTPQDVLEAYEVEDVNRGTDMIILVGYGLLLHAFSLVVLYLRYYAFNGKVVDISKKQN